mmetsp:Transcript_17009/g.64845  ORF Transcript_17009/g.64845 Transcript_17009/m.64845 type:complete len:261 (-) Transcript_17009:2270-3052(-)
MVRSLSSVRNRHVRLGTRPHRQAAAADAGREGERLPEPAQEPRLPLRRQLHRHSRPRCRCVESRTDVRTSDGDHVRHEIVRRQLPVELPSGQGRAAEVSHRLTGHQSYPRRHLADGYLWHAVERVPRRTLERSEVSGWAWRHGGNPCRLGERREIGLFQRGIRPDLQFPQCGESAPQLELDESHGLEDGEPPRVEVFHRRALRLREELREVGLPRRQERWPHGAHGQSQSGAQHHRSHHPGPQLSRRIAVRGSSGVARSP